MAVFYLPYFFVYQQNYSKLLLIL